MSAVGAVCVSDTIPALLPLIAGTMATIMAVMIPRSLFILFMFAQRDGMKMGSADNRGPDGCWFSH